MFVQEACSAVLCVYAVTVLLSCLCCVDSTQQQDVEVMVYFDISTARQLRLTVGCIVRIHSPW